MSRLDLHLHTTHSDGSFTPTEIIDLAQRAGVTALAITDHDITTGVSEAAEAGEARGIEVIPGIEISSVFGGSELHILGYYLDYRDERLNERLTTLRESRHRRNPKIIERLQAAGGRVETATTSREILRGLTSRVAAGAFAPLVHAVEQALFRGALIARADVEACIKNFEQFCQSLGRVGHD